MLDIRVIEAAANANRPLTFKLATDDFFNIGQTFSAFAKPTLFVLEGGYAMHELGENVVNVLDGFEATFVAMQP